MNRYRVHPSPLAPSQSIWNALREISGLTFLHSRVELDSVSLRGVCVESDADGLADAGGVVGGKE